MPGIKRTTTIERTVPAKRSRMSKMTNIMRPVSRLVERKVFDGSVNSFVANTGTILVVNGIASGTDVSGRIGRKVNMLKLQYGFNFNNTLSRLAASTGGNDLLRISVIYDSQPNGVAPAFNDIYDAAGSVNSSLCLLDVNGFDRFQELAVNWLQICDGGPNAQHMSRVVNLKRKKVRYQGTGGGIANIATGALYIVLVTANPSDAQTSIVNGQTRLTYVDE